MGLIQIILIIAFAGAVVWAVTTLIPMPEQFKKAIYVLTVLALFLYVLSVFGVFPGFRHVRLL